MMDSNSPCCYETGSVKKARDIILYKEGTSRVDFVGYFYSCLLVISTAFHAKNAETNISIEGIMSIIRSLCLKSPFRPCLMTTIEREVVIRTANDYHQKWYEMTTKKTYGTERERKKALRAVTTR